MFSDEVGGGLLRALFSDGAGAGRSAPLESLGDGGARGLRALSSSPRMAVLRGFCFLMKQVGCSFDGLSFRRHGRGALRSPTAPRGRDTRGLRCPLELSVDGCSAEVLFSDEAGGAVLLMALVSDGAGRGALRSPTAPWGRRGERAARPLELSAGGCSAGVLFSDEAGGAILLMALVSDGAGRGALRSPTAPRGRDTRGLRCPLELSADGCSAGALFSDEAGGAVLLMALVSDGAGRGALRSPTASRGRGARGLRPSRALPGVGWRG